MHGSTRSRKHKQDDSLNPPATPDTPNRSTAREIEAFVETAFHLGVPRDYGRQRKLKLAREPKHLAFIGFDIHERAQWMTPAAARAWRRMRDAASRDGINLQIVSAFRNVEYQLGILQRKLDRGQSMQEILSVSAAPGYSEHHTGRAIDITTPGFPPLQTEFETSDAFRWLSSNAVAHGFGLSYPRDNPNGISYEPWHWCWHRRR